MPSFFIVIFKHSADIIRFVLLSIKKITTSKNSYEKILCKKPSSGKSSSSDLGMRLSLSKFTKFSVF